MKHRRPAARSRHTLAALAFCAMATAGSLVPAAAVDRTLGAHVPKPSAVGASWSPAQQSSLARDLDAQLASAVTLKGAHVGILAIDARDGTVLYNRNGDDAFMPASTFKMLTGSAALERLGPAFRFRTVAFAEGSVQTGVLHGRLVVRGGGDPLLRVTDFDELAAALKRVGIGRIDGPVDVDTSHFADPPYMPGWSWDDFPYYYAPKISAFSFDENVVHLTIAPAHTAGMRAKITAAPYGRVGEPPGGCALTSDLIVLPHVMTGAPGSADSVDLERDPGGCVIVKGEIPVDAAPETVDAAVPSPEVYAWHVLVDRLRVHGIALTTPRSYAGFAQSVVAAPASANARVVWTHESEPLSDLLADLWLPSDNLLAELLLKSLGAATAEPGTATNGVAYETQWLRTLGIDVAPLSIDDGSGLSAYDRMTPRALVAILQHDWSAPTRETVLDDLPLAGVRGTLKSSFVGTLAEKTVFAKTGSVSHVRALAGYAATQVHGAVIFAFQVDDWSGTEVELNSIRASFLSRIIGDS